VDVARRAVILKYVVGYALTAPPRDLFWKAFETWDIDEQMGFALTAEAQRDQFWNSIYSIGLREFFSRDEIEFAGSTILTMTAQQQVSASWRIEALQILMWALRVIDDLPACDQMADHDLLKDIPRADQALPFIESASLRARNEIDKARDFAELWHWRSRTRQLSEQGDSRGLLRGADRAGVRTFDDIVRYTARFAVEDKVFPAVIDEDFPVKGKAYRDLSDKEWSEVRSISMERHFALNWLCGYAPGNRWDETPTDT
jgi:hypothetical protein